MQIDLILQEQQARIAYLEAALRRLKALAFAGRGRASDGLAGKLVTPYAQTETEQFCYWRGVREGLSFIGPIAHDALMGTWREKR